MSAAAGWEALEAADWRRARAAFEAAPRSGETLDGLGLALWLAGDLHEGVALREQAFDLYVAERQCARAARTAAWVSRQYLISGRGSAANGWLARAERALERIPECAGHGWVAVERARRCESPADGAARARLALELARRHGDDDLEVFALSVLGRADLAAGKVAEGFAELDEAMAAATAGRIRNPHTLGDAYCNLIIASTAAGDWERASEWCARVDDYATTSGINVLNGVCRTVHADVLAASGRWQEAEDSLVEALDAHARGYPAMAGGARAALALLRVKQGRLAEAEELLADRHEQPISLLARAELRLAEAEPESAVALLERALAAVPDDLLTEARLLAPLVSAALAAGDLDRARATSLRLDELAAASGRRLVQARASLAAARLANAESRRGDAGSQARIALELFGGLEMPYEMAEARLELARAVAEELPPLAREEAQAARTSFRALGAARGIDAASAVLQALGAGAPAGLTPRELEVLSLVARGLTNAGIAETLSISEKTAGHHVSRILSKLGARNRAEAAAYAARLVG